MIVYISEEATHRPPRLLPASFAVRCTAPDAAFVPGWLAMVHPRSFFSIFGQRDWWSRACKPLDQHKCRRELLDCVPLLLASDMVRRNLGERRLLRACAREEARAAAQASVAHDARVQTQIGWMQHVLDHSEDVLAARKVQEEKEEAEMSRENRRDKMAEVLRADSEDCFRRLAALEASRPGKERLARDQRVHMEEKQRRIGQEKALNEKMKQLEASKSQVWLQDDANAFPAPSGSCGSQNIHRAEAKEGNQMQSCRGKELPDQTMQSRSSPAKTPKDLETATSLRCSWNEMIGRKNAAKEQERVEKLLLRKAAEQHARALSEERRQDHMKKRMQQQLMKEAYDAQIEEKVRARRIDPFCI